jgi:uncharacterized protein YfaT (DUF1175 family)
MLATTITAHYSQLYQDIPTAARILDLTLLEDDPNPHINFTKAAGLYRQSVEEAIQTLRPDWWLTADGAVYTHNTTVKHLRISEQTRLAQDIAGIDIQAIFKACITPSQTTYAQDY